MRTRFPAFILTAARGKMPDRYAFFPYFQLNWYYYKNESDYYTSYNRKNETACSAARVSKGNG